MIYRNERQEGPYSWEQLVSHARSGNLTGADLVWSETTGDWIRADRVPGLLPLLSSPEPPAPPGRQTTRKTKRTFLFAAGGCLALLLLLACGTLFVFLLEGLPGRAGDGLSPADIVQDAPATVAPDVIPAGGAADDGPFWEEDVEDALGALDDPDWRSYPDRDEEEAAIAQTLEGFAAAMKRGDLDGSVAFILDERREAYRELFGANPAAMASFADVLSGGEMSFLSEYAESAAFNRIAEYAVDLDGFTFYVVFMKVDDTWVLYDF
jgi:hypothetical protein